MWTHASTYRGLGLDKLVHRRRLAALLAMFSRLPLGRTGAWADFGCSDGFILEHVRARVVSPAWQIQGFDHALDLLTEAKNRAIPSAQFDTFDLNVEDHRFDSAFEVVTCFETLEHTGDFRMALDNLLRATRPGGLVLLSVPREVGLPGIAKFVARRILRRNPYGDFFRDRSVLAYTTALLFGRDIEVFRPRHVDSWAVHLGFDYRNFERYLRDRWIARGTCVLLERSLPFPRFNVIYTLRRTEV